MASFGAGRLVLPRSGGNILHMVLSISYSGSAHAGLEIISILSIFDAIVFSQVINQSIIIVLGAMANQLVLAVLSHLP